MSEFNVVVVKVQNITKHPNADSLSIVKVWDYPVIVRTTDFKEGDLAVYVPVDSIVPNLPEWEFLKGKNRIRAVRLRGIFSMGILAKANPTWQEGQNVQQEMGIVKYEPPIQQNMGGDNERDPGFMPVYTDIEGYRKYSDLIPLGDEVVITEKIHGANARFCYHNDRLWVGSHTCIKKFDVSNLWWKAALKYNLEEKLKSYEGLVFYGEIYGQVQDLKYGLNDIALRFFDIFSTKNGCYLDFDNFVDIINEIWGTEANNMMVPILYRGPWDKKLAFFAEGNSTIGPNVIEGFVVKPTEEIFDITVGRVILKMIGEGYLTRKEEK